LADRGELLADPVHVLLQRLVLDEADRSRDLLGRLASQRDLLFLGDQRKLAFAGYGVNGAARYVHTAPRHGEVGRCNRSGARGRWNRRKTPSHHSVPNQTSGSLEAFGLTPGLQEACHSRQLRLTAESILAHCLLHRLRLTVSSSWHGGESHGAQSALVNACPASRERDCFP